MEAGAEQAQGHGSVPGEQLLADEALAGRKSGEIHRLMEDLRSVRSPRPGERPLRQPRPARDRRFVLRPSCWP